MAACKTWPRNVFSSLGLVGRFAIQPLSATSSAAKGGVRTVAVRLPAGPRVKARGGGAVGVDQAGEDHAGQKGELEARLVHAKVEAGRALGRWQRNAIGQRCTLNRGQRAGLTGDAPLRAQQAVLQPRMVPSHGMGQQLSPSRRKSLGCPGGAGGGVVDTYRRPAQASLELRRILAKIVQPPGQPSKGLSSEGPRILGRVFRDLAQMACERFPIRFRSTRDGVRIVCQSRPTSESELFCWS